MNFNIIDNFLEKNDYQELYNLLTSSYFPWYYNDTIAGNTNKGYNNFQFTHAFYYDYSPRSDFFNILGPLITKINPKSIIRIKANLGVFTGEKTIGGMHRDYDFDCTTAVFYINTNNGGTVFENGETVNSLENRIVTFNSKIKHSGFSQTDSKIRCVINLNYTE